MLSRENLVRLALVSLCAVALGGCRIKSAESFESSFHGNDKPGTFSDPYTQGSVGQATGGLKPETHVSRTEEGQPYNPGQTRTAMPEGVRLGDGTSDKGGDEQLPSVYHKKDGDNKPGH